MRIEEKRAGRSRRLAFSESSSVCASVMQVQTGDGIMNAGILRGSASLCMCHTGGNRQ